MGVCVSRPASRRTQDPDSDLEFVTRLPPHLPFTPFTHSYSPSTVSWDAFLLNHSPQYHVAVAAGIVEFLLESVLAPGLKRGATAVAAAGAILICSGQAVRTAAMWHAGACFTHLVAEERREGHVLVTTGPYAVLRHPAYTGWFWWSVGTQLLLVNPLCAIAYAVAASQFFSDRIRHEEATLADFFGEEYRQYAARTWVCIPWLLQRDVAQ